MWVFWLMLAFRLVPRAPTPPHLPMPHDVPTLSVTRR